MMFQLTLDRFSSYLAKGHPFLDDIITRTLIILNHNQFQRAVLDRLCAQVVKTRPSDCQEPRQFVKNGCSQLKLQVCIDALNVPDVLMQCEVCNYNESKPCKISVSQSWFKHIFEIKPDDEEYQFHVVLGLIKLIHEVCHCCTSVFCAFSSLVDSNAKQIKMTPPNIGRTLKTNRTKKSTKEIGDMGFGGEELMLGGRMFPIIANPTENTFKITGLRIDVHNQSSIASKKLVLDRDFINNFFDLDRLKNIDDLSHVKIPLDCSFDINQAAEGSSLHTSPIRVKRQKLKLSSSSASSNFIDSHNLCNIDPNVLYPPFYIPPPVFVPRSPNSIILTEDDEDFCVNGMPSNF